MKRGFTIGLIVTSAAIVGGYLWYKYQKPTGMVKQKTYDVFLQQVLPKEVPFISISELQAADNYFLIDGRTKEEYTVSHIPNAINIPYHKAELDTAKLAAIPNNAPIVVYCSIGFRSGKLAEQLKHYGFNNVYNLYGSIFEWSNRNLPLVDNLGNTTNKIHGYNRLWSLWITNGEVVLNNRN